MNCLPVWVVKMCRMCLTFMHTQQPAQPPAYTPLAVLNKVSIHENNQQMAFNMSSLPPEVQERLLWDSVTVTLHDLLSLKNQITYLLALRTLNKAMNTYLTPTMILEKCGVNSACEAHNAYQNIFDDCPLFIAKVLIARMGLANINEKCDITLDGVLYREIGLLLDATTASNYQRVARLLQLGADPNTPDKFGHTIYNKVEKSQKKIVELLAPYKKQSKPSQN